MLEINLKDKIKLTKDYMLHKVDGENPAFFLFNIASGKMFKLNTTTYNFLSMCDGTRSISSIITTLAKDYQVDYQHVEKDFLPLIKKWFELNILS